MRITLGLGLILLLTGAQACSAASRRSGCGLRGAPAVEQGAPATAPVAVAVPVTAWVTYVEGVAERLLRDGSTEDLETASKISGDDVITLGEGATLALLLSSDAGPGRVVTLRGLQSDRLSNLLPTGSQAKRETAAIPARLAAAVDEPWDADLGEAPRTRAGGGALRGLYPTGKVASPCGAFVFVEDIEIPEDGWFEIRIYDRNPSRTRAEPLVRQRSDASPTDMEDALESLSQKERYYWVVGAFLPDGTEGVTGEPAVFELIKNPFRDDLPSGGFRSPQARSSWHLARAKALVKKRLYTDAYREYALLRSAGGGSKKVDKEMARLERRLGMGPEQSEQLRAGVAKANHTTNTLKLSDGRVLEGRLIQQSEEVVCFEALGTRYRFARDQVDEIEESSRVVLPSAAPFVTVSSKHYRVDTNAGKEHGDQVVAYLEALYDCFQRTFGKALDAHRAKNLHAKVFRDSTDFRAFLDEKHADKRDGQGFYSFGDNTLYMFRSFKGDKETTWATLLHEGTHQLLHMICNQNGAANHLPHFWVLEAVPMFMESLQWEEGRLVVGEPNPSRVQNYQRVLNSGSSMEWGNYLALRQGGFNGADIYDQGHALFWYLMRAEEGMYEKPLMSYVKWMLSTRGRSKAEAKTFRKSVAEIARGSDDWVRDVFLAGKAR